MGAILWGTALPPAVAAPATHVVRPTGTAAFDLVNVQAAVALGGKVILKASNAKGVPTAFNFKPLVSLPEPLLVESARASVRILGDVEIIGEDAGGARTTIVDGSPFWCDYCGRVVIRDINFVRSRYAPLYLLDAKSVEITGNRISDVQPGRLGAAGGPAVLYRGASWFPVSADRR